MKDFRGSHRYVLDCLRGAVLARQPDRLPQCLLEASILERLCDALPAGPIGSALAELESANLLPLDERPAGTASITCSGTSCALDCSRVGSGRIHEP